MIQAKTQQGFAARISTEDNRLYPYTLTDPPVKVEWTRQMYFLVKFTNDLNKNTFYAYPARTIYDRYTLMSFGYALNPDMFQGQLNLKPSGHYTYEVYEVTWAGANPTISETTAPATETHVLPVDPNNGVVRGLVTKGTMYLEDKDGTEQVQYTQHPEPSGTNYIYYGQ